MKDGYGHDDRDPYCSCDKCDGERRLELHVPNDCLFEGDEHKGYQGPRQRRMSK